MNTNRQDWLQDLLNQQSRILVSGHSSLASALGLSPECPVVMRFIADRNTLYSVFLTITCRRDRWAVIKHTIAASEEAQRTLDRLQAVFQVSIPLILFEADNNELFSAAMAPTNFRDVDSNGLQSFFGALNRDLIRNPGVDKGVNASTNDSFQVWGRQHLSTYVVINDFDAIGVDEEFSRPVLFELKRIQEDISTWEPYLDDRNNYIALQKICTIIGGDLRVLAYQQRRQHVVALHFNVKATQTKITGRKLICRADQVLGPKIGVMYESTRRRPPRP